eukprot:TRINITY_DN31075_c0_g1_i1.p1 TRINITY_DN31075_c0_g1~~TRINITY_DN31075_c0_g1_i1.p1  ORF type:complete len:247 (-),score=41.06 TRINITY_DN31075_c0_g1_i1:320-982(-)
MAKKKNRYAGTCGMYVFVAPEAGNTEPVLLVHRRGAKMTEPLQIAAPGGIVEKIHCGPQSDDLDIGAKATAVKELREETGIELTKDIVDILRELPAAPGWFGNGTHKNYCVVYDDFPEVLGPEKESRHELQLDGMRGLGEDAGDRYHAWVPLSELLARTDLLEACRTPMESFYETWLNRFGAADTGASRQSSAHVSDHSEDPVHEPPLKRPRGSVAKFFQ